MESVIEVRRDPQEKVNEDFRDLTGGIVTKPVYYHHLETEKDYSYLIGALAWPVLGGSPGCALIAGSSRSETPSYEILEAISRTSPFSLLQGCETLREKYGFGKERDLLRYFIGEDLFDSLLYDLNRETNRQLYIIAPPDIEKPHSDEIYIRQIRFMTEANRLIIRPQAVQDELRTLTIADADRTIKEINPTAAAVGYVLHYLESNKPWNQQDRFADLDDAGSDEAVNL